jgi:hypothetical protein
MSRFCSSVFFFGACACVLGGSSLRAGNLFGPPKDTEVNIVVDLTEDGRKVPLPTRAQPAFYFPVVGGYREMGALVAGEKRPPATPVARLLAKALAAQGYLVMGEKTPPPTLLLVFHWGYMNPQIDDATPAVPPDDPSQALPQQIFWNQKEMLALVAGHTLTDRVMGFEREDVLQAAREDRYFVLVAAFDFEAAKERKKKLLWLARMSTPSNRITLAEALPALIASGGPHFGRETDRPQIVTALLAREGKVEVGTPTVVDEPGKAKSATPARDASPRRP